MAFEKPRHNAAKPNPGMRVSHGQDGPGTITSVIVKGNNYLCITKHDSGPKKGHFWSSLTDVGVPAAPPRRDDRRPPAAGLVPA